MDPYQANAADPLFSYFQQCAGHDGQISPNELHALLVSSGVGGGYVFGQETARQLIQMLDRDYSANMGFAEFREMWQALRQWRESFEKFDRNKNGTINFLELRTALLTFGYNLPDGLIDAARRRFNCLGNENMLFSDFINCCITLRALTSQFRSRDRDQDATITIGYDDYMQVMIGL